MEKSGEEGMPDLAHVIRILTAENIPNLPPGGGLAGKWVQYWNFLNCFIHWNKYFYLNILKLSYCNSYTQIKEKSCFFIF